MYKILNAEISTWARYTLYKLATKANDKFTHI